jgi:hypothetical protein
MKLHIKRNQASGMMGGIKFELTGQVTLSPDETELVKKYKAGTQVLLKKEIKIPLTSRVLIVDVTIGSLVSGQNFKSESIGDILEYEEQLKISCQNFKTYITAMRSFGGEEVIEF